LRIDDCNIPLSRFRSAEEHGVDDPKEETAECNEGIENEAKAKYGRLKVEAGLSEVNWYEDDPGEERR